MRFRTRITRQRNGPNSMGGQRTKEFLALAIYVWLTVPTSILGWIPHLIGLSYGPFLAMGGIFAFVLAWFALRK